MLQVTVCTLGSCSMLTLQRWTRFCVTICTLDYCSRLYLQRWTRISVIGHCLYPWLLHQTTLTEVDKALCYRSVCNLGYCSMLYIVLIEVDMQGLVLQVTVCTLGYWSWLNLQITTGFGIMNPILPLITVSRLYLQRLTKSSVTSHSLYPWLLLWAILAEVDKVLVL